MYNGKDLFLLLLELSEEEKSLPIIEHYPGSHDFEEITTKSYNDCVTAITFENIKNKQRFLFIRSISKKNFNDHEL